MLVDSGLVNGVNLDEMTAAAVLKSTEDLTTVTADKQFSESVTLGNAVFQGSVFGIQVMKVFFL